MNVRDLLRYEVWSKRTTRKLFVALGTFSALIAVGLVLCSVVDQSWITPGERIAAKGALGKLDALQNAGLVDEKEFVVWARLAGRNVDYASRAARTSRDRKIVGKLMNYEATIMINRFLEKKQVLAQQQNSGGKPDQRMAGFALSGIGFDPRELHKELD